MECDSSLHQPSEIGAAISTILLVTGHGANFGFQLQIAFWIWLSRWLRTLRRQWQRDAARRKRKLCVTRRPRRLGKRLKLGGTIEKVPAQQLRKDDVVVVSAGELIPGDGEVIEGAATVDESAITGESAPVIRESGSDRSAVTGGTK
jgi:K+-transporting ATPase ATPase B chain